MTDTVSQNEDLTRFEITSDGSLAGFTQYVEAGLQRIFFHCGWCRCVLTSRSSSSAMSSTRISRIR